MPHRENDRTWYLIANATTAKIFERPARSRPAGKIWDDVDDAAARRPREIDTDRPGASHDRYGHGMPPMDREEGPDERAAANRARELAERLREARSAGRFDRLLVIAEPSMLGRIRGELDGPTAGLLAATDDRNLADERDDHLRRRLDRLDGAAPGSSPPRQRPEVQQEKP